MKVIEPLGKYKAYASKTKASERNHPTPTPPRPMTEEEKEWYKIHKSLKGFVK